MGLAERKALRVLLLVMASGFQVWVLCESLFLLVWTGEWSLGFVTRLQTCPKSRIPRLERVDWTVRRLRTWLSGGCKNSDG